jgi:hypothetical protein
MNKMFPLCVRFTLISIVTLSANKAISQAQVYYENMPGMESNTNRQYMQRKILKEIKPGTLAEFCQNGNNSAECENIRSAAAYKLARYNPNNVEIVKVEQDYHSGGGVAGKKVTVNFGGDMLMVCPVPKSEDVYVSGTRTGGFAQPSTCEYLSAADNKIDAAKNHQTTTKNQCMHEMMTRGWQGNLSHAEKMTMFQKCLSL